GSAGVLRRGPRRHSARRPGARAKPVMSHDPSTEHRVLRHRQSTPAAQPTDTRTGRMIRPHRLLALVAAALLSATGARAAEPPRVTLHPLPTAPRLASPAAHGTQADPRAGGLVDFVQRTRSQATASAAAADAERAARVRDQRRFVDALERLRARVGGDVEVKMDARRRTPRMLRGRLQRATRAGAGRT